MSLTFTILLTSLIERNTKSTGPCRRTGLNEGTPPPYCREVFARWAMRDRNRTRSDISKMSSPVDPIDGLPPLPRRTPKPTRTWRYVLLLVTLLLVANSIAGERGLVALFRANQEHAYQQEMLDALRTENDRLHRYAEALADQPRFIEDLARRNLGMIKPGEQLFIVRTTEQSTDDLTTGTPDPPTGTTIP